MKKLIGISPILVFAFLVSLQTGVSSCTKEKIILDTVTVTKTDTLTIRDTLTIQDTAVSLELLTANSWKFQELRGVKAGNVIFYQRGGTSNTENFDDDYIWFRTDGTGTYFDHDGYIHELAWEFSNEAKTKLTMVVSNPAPEHNHTMIWENLRYKNKALMYDEYWTYDYINFHSQVIRIPR